MNGYYLLIKFGDNILPVNISTLKELTIIQDYDKYLPGFRLVIEDVSGILSHVAPCDRSMSKVTIEIGESTESNKNSFEFMVYEKTPTSNSSLPSNTFEITGLLNIDGFFSPDYSRGFNQSIKTTLEYIATNDLKIVNTNVSATLDYVKLIIQPQWSDAQLLKYLKDNVVGNSGEASYKCFVNNKYSKVYFNFRSISEMGKDPILYKFILSDKEYEDWLPIYKYDIYDNCKIYGSFASKKQGYGYFNYDTSTYVTGTETATDLTSLTDYFLIDKNDTEYSNTLIDNGRTNEFTSDFKGKVRSSYHNRLMGLSKMWITTKGISAIQPGETVGIFFPYANASKDLYSYQYSGFWLIERVVHNIGSTFLTKLLLTRNGLDTNIKNTLVKAVTKKKI